MKALVLGTSVIDVFLNADKDHYVLKDKTVSFTLGDKIPSEVTKFTIGGNGANVSVGLSRLGIDTSFYTYLGDDILATQIHEGLKKEGIELLEDRGVNELTSLHLIFNFSDDRIIFSDYKEKEYTFKPPLSAHYDIIYLTSVARRWENAYQNLLSYQASHMIPLAFSPGSRQLSDMGELFYKTLSASKFLFCNKEEAQHILKSTGREVESLKDILLALKELGPSIISVTDGLSGGYAIDENDNVYHILPFSDEKKIVQKTGAGDSYASGFLASYIEKSDIKEAMRVGAFNAHGVMLHLGAEEGLLTKDVIIKLSESNKNYQSQQI